MSHGTTDTNDLLISMLDANGVTTDQVIVDNWFSGQALDEVDLGDYHLDTNAVEQLVAAMSSFAVPSGAGQALPQTIEDIYQNSLVTPA